MSDSIKHECGIAFIRLLKPLEYYQAKYGTWKYGLNKLYLLMEKQHNRGQDGAGIAFCKLDAKPGTEYLTRIRSNKNSPIAKIFNTINSPYIEIQKTKPELLKDAHWIQQNTPFAADIYLGHLRYGTFGGNDIANTHPVSRENNWKTRNLMLAGNFNLANMDELFNKLIELGQHPRGYTDIVTILEKIGHFLDRENQKLFAEYKAAGKNNVQISDAISHNINVPNVLREASKYWDGGYVIAGIIGHGDSFITRDPSGIRPAFYFANDEVVVAASERPVIQTVFNVGVDDVKELEPGHILVVKRDGTIVNELIREQQENRACSFERIYFSRGSDIDIYKERKKLGEFVVPQILESVSHDIEHTVLSFIPNTAESAFYGMIKGMQDYIDSIKQTKILELQKSGNLTPELLADILAMRPRSEKLAIKDVKLRTFITEDKSRDDLVGHVYDVTYGIVKPSDNLVVIDDSIVRGTTLKKSIFKILNRLHPKKIIIVSSAPQIRYPDCYGIDMAKLGDLCAFNAAIALLKETKQEGIINSVYNKSAAQRHLPKEEIVNYVQEIYAPFTDEQISKKIAQMLTPEDVTAEIDIIFQSVENLHKACPNHKGDWYFTGNYPTPGGNRAVNNAFLNYIEGRNERAY
ncbi:MAG TPA: amidophosphoribosyltransferase [Bacteroidales bacterium]|nr:MAG: Amidophosphoribosyltransferase precursor [Bacteroidetes bacterium ADurb.Bin217]HOS83625.1 amidophosphoribosyltransferase [Bacteroidales bacterium]HPM12268.1 amidophosphoribosyltransferase [Bacteroidales bacterium]